MKKGKLLWSLSTAGGGLSRREQIERYAVTGGVPKYIESFIGCEDIFTGIEKNILDRTGYLYEEPHFLLQREVPVTEGNPEKSKKGLYRITDYYIRFWFTMIYPNQGDIEQGNVTYVMDKIKKRFVTGHVAYIYEDVCRAELSEKAGLPCHFSKIGRYWDKNTEIDVVALSEEERTILFGECKYLGEAVDVDVLYQLQEKAKRVAWHREDRRELYCIFSIGGFSRQLRELAAAREDIFLYA